MRKLWLWGLVVGLAGNAVYLYFGELSHRAVPSAANLISATALAAMPFSTLRCRMSEKPKTTCSRLRKSAIWRRGTARSIISKALAVMV